MIDSAQSYSAILARCVIATAGDGLDARMLLHEAALPDTVLSSEYGMVSSRAYLRLWEVAEFHQQAPAVGLRIADTYRIGRFGVYDYLFSTAATVADGIAAVRECGGTMATNHEYRVDPDGTDRAHERTTALVLADGVGSGVDLTVQAAYASTVARMRYATGASITPTRITLRQQPPQTSTAFRDVFGTRDIEFDAPVDSMTFRIDDLARPLRTADPVLAAILRQHAETLSTPQLDDPSWPERVQAALMAAISEGDASLQTVARRLTVSPRTLQRRLAEADTTWRQELDRARQTLADSADGRATRSAVAHRLGYSDARALRRAARRWNSTTTKQSTSPELTSPELA